MKILTTTDGTILSYAHNFDFGPWEEDDTLNGNVVHKWKVEDKHGNTMLYILDANINAYMGIEPPALIVHEVQEVPDDIDSGKYLYINDKFTVNHNWTEPAVPIEQKVDQLESNVICTQLALAKQYETGIAIEDDLLRTQLALAEQYEANIVIEEDLLRTQLALAEQYEANLLVEDDLLRTQLALAEQYEANIVLEETIAQIKIDIDNLKNGVNA